MKDFELKTVLVLGTSELLLRYDLRALRCCNVLDECKMDILYRLLYI